MYESFTHLAKNTSEALAQAHRDETQRLRDLAEAGGGDWEGLAQTWDAALSPAAKERPLSPADLDTGHIIVGPQPTDEALSAAISARLADMPHDRGQGGYVEALPYRDTDGTPGWFFYGWSRLP